MPQRLKRLQDNNENRERIDPRNSEVPRRPRVVLRRTRNRRCDCYQQDECVTEMFLMRSSNGLYTMVPPSEHAHGGQNHRRSNFVLTDGRWNDKSVSHHNYSPTCLLGFRKAFVPVVVYQSPISISPKMNKNMRKTKMFKLVLLYKLF